MTRRSILRTLDRDTYLANRWVRRAQAYDRGGIAGVARFEGRRIARRTIFSLLRGMK